MSIVVAIATEHVFATLLVYRNPTTVATVLTIQWCWCNFSWLRGISDYISSMTMNMGGDQCQNVELFGGR